MVPWILGAIWNTSYMLNELLKHGSKHECSELLIMEEAGSPGNPRGLHPRRFEYWDGVECYDESGSIYCTLTPIRGSTQVVSALRSGTLWNGLSCLIRGST